MQQSEICCVCIRTNLELIRITETDPNTIKYSCKLNQCVPEVVWNEDNRICEQCIEQLEAACAFRELCLQSHTIRRQLLERNVPVHEVKSEEITIEHENIPTIKIETDQELNLGQKSPEFANVKVCYTLPEEDELQVQPRNSNPNKSYLRDLLETPQEILKVRNYTVNKNYTQYMKEKVNDASNRFLPEDLQKSKNILDDNYHDDDIMYVDPNENDLNPLEGVLETVQAETIEIRPQGGQANEDEERKSYNLHEDGIELVEESGFSKSLLRDLLLKPQEAQKIRNNHFQSPQTNPPLQTQSLNHKDQKSFFDNRISRLPDTPRTEHYYQCKHCAIKFKDRRLLTKHNRDLHHQFNRPWDCIYCNKSFKSLPELKQHEKSHLNQRKYECNICCRSYNTTSVLAKHKSIKHKSPNDWRYLCPHCDQKYPFKAYRDQHIRRHHTNAGNEYICFHCNTGFSSKLLLIAHIRYKHNTENIMKQCHICQNTYINQAELEGHMLQRHNLETIKFPKKIKKYKCDKCTKLYTTLKAKNSHYDKCDGIRRHTSKKITEVKLEWTPSS